MSSSNENIVSFHIAGDAFVDFFCFLDGDWPENGGDSRLEQPVKAYAGGSATNTATHLKSLVCHFMDQKPQVKLHTVLNPNDHYGELLIQHAKDHEFPIVNCLRENDTSSTGHCIAIVSGGERSFMTHQGSMQNFAVDDLDLTSIISTETNLHCHVAGFYNIPGFWNGKLKQALQEIRRQRKKQFPDKNTTISLVTQHDATKGWDGGLDELVPLLDFTIMNDLEATHIVKRGRGRLDENSEHEIENWASFFGAISPEANVIVTRGEKGAVALRGGEIIANQSTIIVTPVDPTGAGDSFTAGFLHGVWSWKLESRTKVDDKWPIEAIKEGLLWGCAVGSAKMLIRGASNPVLPEEIENFRKRIMNLH